MEKKTFKWTVILLFVNMIFWMILLARYLYRFGGELSEPIYLAMCVLMSLDLLSYGMFIFALRKSAGRLRFFLIPFLIINAVMSVTDQFGLLDVAALIMNVLTILVYLCEKRSVNHRAVRKIRRTIFNSFKYAFDGICLAVKSERNIRIEIISAAAVLTAGLLLKISCMQIMIIVLCCIVVIGFELLNSALERAVDLASGRYSGLAKQAKDLAAGAVLIASIGAAAVGACIFIPRLVGLLTV